MKKAKTLLAVIFTSLFFLVTVYFVSANEADNSMKNEQIIADSYPKEIQEAFMNSCIENDGLEIICRCVIDNMPLQVSLETLGSGTDLTPILTDITNECMAKHIKN